MTTLVFRIKRMKYTIIPLLVFLCLSADAQFFHYPFPPTKADYAKNAAAQVKICYEYMIVYDQKTLNRVLEYGAAGLPVVLYEKGTNTAGDSTTISENSYKYSNGRLVMESVTNYVSEEAYKIYYTYNAAGKLLKKMVVEIDPSTYTYVYDKLGRAVKATIKVRMPEETGKPVDVPRGRYDYTYNIKGQLVQQTHYSQDNEKQFTAKWEYNNKGQIVKITSYAHGELVYEELLEYGSNNLLSKRTENKPQEATTVFVYEYCTTCKQSWMN